MKAAMSAPVHDENPEHVPSPCVSVCALDASGRICMGCFRTLDEIAAWGTLEATEKRRILTELPARKAASATR